MTASSLPGLLEELLPPETVLRTMLANGLRVVVREDRSAPVVAVVTYVRAGYFDEPDDVVGIAHVLEHMYFKGTTTRGVGEIARETKASGGYLNAGTIYDHTHYYTVLPSSGFEVGLEIQADAYANSLVDAKELQKELEVIIEEVKRKADSPAALSTEKLFALLHDQHRIRRWRMGREEGLRSLTAERVVQFYRNFYRPSNTVLVVVGDVDAGHALDLIKRLYGRLPDAEVTRTPGPFEPDPVSPAFRYLDMSGDIRQTELQFGWRVPPITHEDTPALDLLAAVMGNGRASRLYRAVRERRLASSVTAYNYTPDEVGVFVVHARARPQRAREAAAAVWDQLRRGREGEITEVEVERARRVLQAQWLRRMETMYGQAAHIAGWELLGDWQLGAQYLDRLLGTGAQRLAEVAARYLTPERAGLVVYRPADSPALARDAAEMRASLDGAPVELLPGLTRPRRPSPVPGSRAWRLEREEERIFVYRTSAGIPVLIQRRAGAIAHLGWFVRGGAVYESPREAGLTMLMARTSLKGTERRSAQRIAEDAEFLGGVLAGSADADSFQWTISLPVNRLDDAAELLGDVVQRPLFSEDALESERAVALANIASLRDDMYQWPLRLAIGAAWAGHPYGQSVLGTEESLAAIDVPALRRWHERCALEAPGVLVMVADVDPDAGAGLAARYFGALRAVERPLVPPPDWPLRMIERSDEREKAQSALAMLFPGPSRSEDSRFAVAMIAGVASGLGGRFFDELRDRQSLAYTVIAAPVLRQRAGAFSAYIAMSPEKEEVARRGLLAEFAKLCEEPVTDRELTQAKTYALGSWAIRRENSGNVLNDIADAWLFGRALRELAEYESRVRAVTAREMLGLARKYFEAGRRVEGVVRSADRRV
ncbi:MAG TPA: pitrilysin family protein [Gemmatimonadaceae bacterium]|nr:pitrilysin family protein [Gemmatimonadaceae bacterium]